MFDIKIMPQPQPLQQKQQPQEPNTTNINFIIEAAVSGIVKWFNVKRGYGFITRNDTKRDVFVHQTGILRNNPRKLERSVGDGEAVEFAVAIGKKGFQAVDVTGPGGIPVKGSPYAANKRRGSYYQHYPYQDRRGDDRVPRRGVIGYRRFPESNQGSPQRKCDALEGDEASSQRGHCRRNFRGERRSPPFNQWGVQGYVEQGRSRARLQHDLFRRYFRDGYYESPASPSSVQGYLEQGRSRVRMQRGYFRANFGGGHHGSPGNQRGVPGYVEQERSDAQLRRGYYQDGHRGGNAEPMNCGGYLRTRPHNFSQRQGRNRFN